MAVKGQAQGGDQGAAVAAATRQAVVAVKGQAQAGRQGGQVAAVAKGGKRGRAVKGGQGADVVKGSSGGGQGGQAQAGGQASGYEGPAYCGLAWPNKFLMFSDPVPHAPAAAEAAVSSSYCMGQAIPNEKKNFLSTGPETSRKRSVCSKASKRDIERVPYTAVLNF